MARLPYTKEMARKIREIKPPYKGINFDIIDREEYVSIRIKEEFLMSLDNEKQIAVMEYLFQIKSMIESFGLVCDLEGLRYRGN